MPRARWFGTRPWSAIACLAVIALGLGSVAPTAASMGVAGSRNGRVPAPTVTGPIPGKPTSLSVVDLARPGYVQKEFFVEGTARAYGPAGPLGEDGRWDVTPTTSAPYKVRVLVRSPKDAARFNGTVVVEWLNVSGGLDAEPEWGLGHAELLRGGYAWVGVSAQADGIKTLRAGGAGRYESLSHPGDSYSYDIYSQAGQAIRRPTRTNLLGSRAFTVKHVLAAGESQSAFRLVTYVNAIHPLARVFDGFLVHSRFSVGAALFQGEGGNVPGPTFIRTDLKEPVLVLESETDVPKHLTARQPDGTNYRLWEVAGTAHYDEDGLNALTGIPKEAMVTSPPLGCRQRINSAPMRYVVDAAIHSLTRWVASGRPPPHAPRMAVTPGEPPTIERDQFGNARGGIRLPQLEAPTSTLAGEGNSPGWCGLFGTTTAFDATRLASLYPSHRAYVADFTKATHGLLRAGFILAPDADEARAEARRSSIGQG